jgi:hypothetical protein
LRQFGVRSRGFLAVLSIFILILSLTSPVSAAGALSVGQCGAYGQAYDFPNEQGAAAAASKQCKGNCKTLTMRKACAALSLDMKNPCGAFGYAVAPRISSALNTAMRKCYEHGGKECVIRAWTCDARG